MSEDLRKHAVRFMGHGESALRSLARDLEEMRDRALMRAGELKAGIAYQEQEGAALSAGAEACMMVQREDAAVEPLPSLEELREILGVAREKAPPSLFGGSLSAQAGAVLDLLRRRDAAPRRARMSDEAVAEALYLGHMAALGMKRPAAFATRQEYLRDMYLTQATSARHALGLLPHDPATAEAAEPPAPAPLTAVQRRALQGLRAAVARTTWVPTSIAEAIRAVLATFPDPTGGEHP